MKKQIKFFDTTLRDGEQTPGVTLSTEDKVQIAKQLDKLGVDIIEAGFAIASPGDFEAVTTVAKTVSNNVTVSSLARALTKDIDTAWEAVKHAHRPRIHTFIATSDIHMQFKLKMTPEQVIEQTAAMVKYARNLCEDVEFSAEDAGRTRPEFLYKVVETAIKAGATVINIPDTVGYRMPEEFGALIKSIVENVPNIDKSELSVHCHNDLGLAVANSLAAIMNGATQVECTINGLGERAGNAALEEIVMALTTRKDLFNATHNIKTTEIFRTSRLVTNLTGIEVQPNKAIVGANAFAHESGIHQHGMLSNAQTYEIMTPESVGVPVSKMVLGKLSGKHAFAEKVNELGFTLTEAELEEAFKGFKNLADRKKTILDADIEALISNSEFRDSDFVFDSYTVSCGNRADSTATVILSRGENTVHQTATGDGPVNAAFNAIEKIIEEKLTLDSYSIKAVTEGSDAQGEVIVKLIHKSKVYTGRGVSTDIIEASIRAYINAVNKMPLG